MKLSASIKIERFGINVSQELDLDKITITKTSKNGDSSEMTLEDFLNKVIQKLDQLEAKAGVKVDNFF